MASLIPGYEYDIFISYRQKDNKYDGWVTEFVDNLKKELEATFKEEISVYFDINPHDGLLETHDVDASLKEKLKCLIFIPIISRTYCDPKSFAWEHEFKAFVELASQDQFGLKIKLPNGNVASRVLPIRIYDLDSGDIKLCESLLGGILRGIEFIYSEPGVNRPLKPDDDEKINLNKTKYRNQINKVGNAIKEVITGLKTEPVEKVEEKIKKQEPLEEIKKEELIEVHEKPARISKLRVLSGVAILAILIVAAILVYPKIFKRDTIERLRASGERISIAVMPFQNLTNDTLMNVWQIGIQDYLITSFPSSEELIVKQRELVTTLLQSKGLTNFSSVSVSDAGSISRRLDANVFIYGTITKAGSTIRLNGQLTDSETGDLLKSFQVEGTTGKIMHTIDSLSGLISNYLLVSKMEKDLYSKVPSGQFSRGITTSPEAFRLYVLGKNAESIPDWPSAIKWYTKAVSIDSTFNVAYIYLIIAYQTIGRIDSARKVCSRLYKKIDHLPPNEQLTINWANAWLNETPNEEIKYNLLMLESDKQDPIVLMNLGDKYYFLHDYDKAVPLYEEAMVIYNKWGTKLSPVWHYLQIGKAYHEKNKYTEEKELYKKAEQYYPYDFNITSRQAVLALEKDTSAVKGLFEKYRSQRKRNTNTTDGTITSGIAQIYSEAGMLDKAEEYYRKALSSEPNNAGLMNSLAYFLIEKDRNIYGGMELIDKALKISPNNFNYLHTKGWGLYKIGNYKEAMEKLQKSWDLRRQNALYNHDAFLHLEAAKKAVAGLK
jgi:tetratricopeptide (TPR) repeat protein